MRTLALTILLLFMPNPLAAQPAIDQIGYLPTEGERRAANAAGWATVGTLVALDVRDAWKAPNRTHALQMTAARLFITWAWASMAKELSHRQRPDRSNDQSFYSMHTALAFQTLGGPRVAIVVPLAIGTGGLRVAAGKHWLTDTLVGAAVGAATSRIRDKR